jgi:hypothetical protein
MNMKIIPRDMFDFNVPAGASAKIADHFISTNNTAANASPITNSVQSKGPGGNSSSSIFSNSPGKSSPNDSKGVQIILQVIAFAAIGVIVGMVINYIVNEINA